MLTIGFHHSPDEMVRAERGGQLDPQSVAVQSIGVLIGSPSSIAGELLRSFGV